MRKLCETFKHFRGQPVEIITEHEIFCGIDLDSDEDGVLIIDDEGRLIRIENRKIEAIIEPQMRLQRLCSRVDCDCRRRGNDNDYDCRGDDD